jgi:hypothetical protein
VNSVQQISLTDLIPDIHNANKHSERGYNQLTESIERLGVGDAIIVDKDGRIVGGNLRHEVMTTADITDAVLVQTDRKTPVVVQLTDLELDSAEGRSLAVALNRVAEVSLEWSAEELQWADELGAKLGVFWRPDELERFEIDTEGEELNYDEMWQGMPEFEQDGIKTFHSIKVHFKTEADLIAFADLVGQTVTESTKYIYYPKQENIDGKQFKVLDSES